MKSKIALGVAIVVALAVVALVVRARRSSTRIVFWHMEDERTSGDLFATSGSGGTPKRYCKTKGERMAPLAFSRDGARLAYAETGGPSGPWRLHVANGDDCEDDRVVATSDASSYEPIALSPDGAWLAYAAYVTRPNLRKARRAHDGGDREIFIVGDGAPIQLSNDDADDDFPAWSPDGARLAFVSARDGDGDLYLADVASHRLTRITTGSLVRFARIAWSPDGSAIAIARGPVDQRDVVTVSPTGELRTVATHAAINAALKLDRSDVDTLAWSPTGTHLVATVSRMSGGMRTTIYQTRVVSIALDTGAVVLLVDGQARCPAVSPDGKTVAMSMSRSMPNDEIIAGVAIGGGNADLLVKTDGCPTWLSPPAR